jgi:hypothetical protein
MGLTLLAVGASASFEMAYRLESAHTRAHSGGSCASWGVELLRLSILIASTLVCAQATAFAQTKGRISVGASVTHNATTDGDVSSATGFGPLVRLNPHKGWGPAGAFNWFRADLQNPVAGVDDFARLRVRPLMGGVSYTVASGALMTSFSMVGGPSFNKVEFKQPYVTAPAESIDAGNSFAVRPGIGVTLTVAPRVAIVGFGGYLINRPGIVYRNRFGQELRDRWNADALVLSVGAVYSLF